MWHSGRGLVILLLLVSLMSALPSAKAQDTHIPSPTDVMLVIDNSGSMYRAPSPSDPKGYRFTVAKYLVNYLSVVESGKGRYRLGAVSFGGDAALVVPLTSVENRLSVSPRLENTGDINPNSTNHDVALETALDHMTKSQSFGGGQVPFVVMLTDGMLKDSRFGEQGQAQYKALVSEVVDRMRRLRCRLYVVLIGDAATSEEADFWRQQARSTRGDVFSIESPPQKPTDQELYDFMRGLMDVFHRIAVAIAGGTVSPSETDVITEQNREIQFDLDKSNYPYVSQLVLTILQTGRAAIAGFEVDVNGQVQRPQPDIAPEGGWDVGVWRFAAPLHGRWKIRFGPGSEPSGVVVWIDRLFLEPHLNSPDPGQWLLPGQPLEIKAAVVSEKLIPVEMDPEYPIRVSVEIVRPSGASAVHEMTRDDSGSPACKFNYTFNDTGSPGEYTVRLTSYWTRKGATVPLDMRTSEWTFLVADLPRSGGLVRSAYEIGEDALLELLVLGSANQASLSVQGRLLDPNGNPVGGQVTLVDDGSAGDQKAGDGIFTTQLGRASFGQVGQHTLQVEFVGESKDSPPIRYGPGRERQLRDSVAFTVTMTLPSVWVEYPESGATYSAGDDIPARVRLKQFEKCTDLSLVASLFDARGKEINSVALHDDGQSGDDKAGDGLFGGILKGGATVPDTYTLRLRLVGTHQSGYKFQRDFDDSITVMPAVAPRVASVNLAQVRVMRGSEAAVDVKIADWDRAASIQVTGVVSTPYGEFEFPLTPLGDGKYRGTIPASVTRGRLGPEMWGERNLKVRCSGTGKTGIAFTAESEPIPFSVVPSLLDKVLGGLIAALLVWTLIWALAIRDQKPRYVVGTLEVEYPISSYGQRQWVLDDLLAREVTVGIGAGGVSLPLVEGGAKEGIYLRLVARLRKRRFSMPPVAFRANRDRDITPLVGGVEPPYVSPSLLHLPIIGRLIMRKGVELFDQADLEVGDYRLNYSYTAPEDM